MAVVDNGTSATLFVSNAGFGVGGADGNPPVFKQATVLRLDLDVPAGKPPVVKQETVVGSGFGAQADKGVFLVGPTGLALSPDQKLLYVSDAIGNRITEIDDPMTRDTSAGVGRQLTADGLLHRPLAMVTAPNGHLLVTNALNGQIVEIDPATRQADLRALDRHRQGAIAAGQRRPVRPRDDARRRRFLLRRGRREHTGAREVSVHSPKQRTKVK